MASRGTCEEDECHLNQIRTVLDQPTAAETAAALPPPPRYATYAMSRGTLTSAEP